MPLSPKFAIIYLYILSAIEAFICLVNHEMGTTLIQSSDTLLTISNALVPYHTM